MIAVLEFIMILVLNILVASIILVQDYYVGSIKLFYYQKIGAMLVIIRSLLSIWITYSMIATLLGTLKILAVQSVILLCLWGLMHCVKKYGGKWYITMIALIIYGLSCYFHIMYAKTV
ncbi:hypothetical protein [Bacillus mobilis]|uniref:hypothetical protein n=1 Tax=Bacillus mobilis TaxID=2026190 RepID=UPI000A303D31|nr:hypothetical protein [Bacillus mobilis]MCU5593250.1 hypothetical protein [Bacillus mobilis]MCU5735995.1 hypothetical protein [Bacillus mobilis]MCU9560635.1 hypothetical protein [Bacillus mobilis]SME17937.1 hypothetical protein BACERE00177_03134 [Bacillus mobilis]HDR7514892.1 hypothetical protein [Bacillus mobilis]